MEAYDLPAAFAEFSQARQNGFLRAKAVREQGGHIVGTFCTYTPNELFDAAGLHTVSLCGTSEETVGIAESELPRNLCPLIKSSYGFALSDKCPQGELWQGIIGLKGPNLLRCRVAKPRNSARLFLRLCALPRNKFGPFRLADHKKSRFCANARQRREAYPLWYSDRR